MLLKKKRKYFFCFLSWLVGLVFFGGAPRSFAEADLAGAIAIYKKKLDEDLPNSIGYGIAILHRGKIVYQKVGGHQYKGGPAITTDTLFAVGSLSKPFTAVVVHDLIFSQKKLKLESSVAAYVPRAADGIQVQHLLSHTSGYTFKGASEIESGWPRVKILDRILSTNPSKPAGKVFTYNNLAFSLIEDVVTKATGKAWPVVFQETMAKRGLRHIAICEPPAYAAVAYPHHFNSESKTLKPPVGRLPLNYPKTVSSSAGVFASLNDLIAFAKLQLTGEFDTWLEPRTLASDALYWPSAPYPNRLRSSYALGWRVFELKDDSIKDSRFVFHGGFIKGVSAFIGLLRKHDLALVALVNDDQFIPQRSAMAFYGGLYTSTQKKHSSPARI